MLSLEPLARWPQNWLTVKATPQHPREADGCRVIQRTGRLICLRIFLTHTHKNTMLPEYDETLRSDFRVRSHHGKRSSSVFQKTRSRRRDNDAWLPRNSQPSDPPVRPVCLWFKTQRSTPQLTIQPRGRPSQLKKAKRRPRGGVCSCSWVASTKR